MAGEDFAHQFPQDLFVLADQDGFLAAAQGFAEAGAAAVDLPFRQRCFPHNKVGKRLSRGPVHSLRLFYYIAVTGDLTLGTVNDRPSPGTAGQ